MTPQQFSEVADLFPHAALLLSRDGEVLAVNRAVIEWNSEAPFVGRRLHDLVKNAPETTNEFLAQCARSHQPVIGQLQFHEFAGRAMLARCYGAAVHDRPGEPVDRIFMRLVPDEVPPVHLGTLNHRIGELNDELQRKEESEQRLREQSELLRVTLSSIGDAVITTDQNGRVTFVNPVAEEITGWSLSAAYDRPLDEIFHIVNEHSRLPVENPVTKVLREGQIVGLANHTVLIARDGTERPIDDSAAPIRNLQGEIVGVVLVFRDVTLRRREERVRRQLAAIIESSDDAILSKKLDGTITSWNRGAERIYGYTENEMVGRSFSVLVPEERVEESLRVLRKMEKGERIDPFETQRITRDGRLIDVAVSYSPLINRDGDLTGISVIAHDLTEQKRAEQRAREDRSRLESTLAAVEIGTWEYDVIRNRVRADRNLARMFGVTPEDASDGPLGAYLRAVHPEDHVRVAGVIESALQSGEQFEVEYRLLESDQNVRWIVARGRVERDSRGQVVRLPGVVIDITDRKEAQERERELAYQAATANAQFRAFFEQGAIFAGIMALDGTLIEPNRLSLDACGYTREQVVGKLFWECPWWNRSEHLIEQIRAACQVAAGGEQYRAETSYYVADGDQRVVDLCILPIKDAAGKVVFLAPTGTDVTDRLRAEQGLRNSEGRHRFLLQLSQALQPLTDSGEIMFLASRMLAEELEVSRCAYAEVESQSILEITSDYTNGVPSLVGRWPITVLGGECVRALLADEPFFVGDVASDSRVTPEEKTAFRETAIAAAVYVPLRRAGKLSAVMEVHHSQPRTWDAADVELLSSVLTRCWEAVERSRAVQAERRLHAEVLSEQARLEDLFRLAPSFMAVLQGPEHIFERANDRYSILVGNRELIGRPILQAMPELAGQSFLQILDQVYESGEACLATDARVSISYPPDDRLQERILDLVYQPLRDAEGAVAGVLVQGIDLTERRLAEARLTKVTTESDRRRRLYEAALSSTPDLVYVFDLDHRFAYVNDALLKMWGKTWEEAIGRTCLELGYEPWHAQMHNDEIDRVRETKQPIRGEVPFTGTLGRRVYDYIFVPVIGADGEVEAVAGTTRDVTERQGLEQELREADKRKDEFLAMLAHELRNPLAPVRTGLELLSLSGAEQECIDVMRDQINHLVRLVDDLLDVSRITRGKIQLRPEPVDLVEIAQRAIEQIRPAATARQQTLTVTVSAAPIWMNADPVRMAQVVANLLNNSVKYTEPGGRIWLTLSREHDAVLSVRDNGIGLDSQLLPRVFDLFTQADRSLERSEGGLGIGLTLVKNLVEMHSGTVQALSEGLGMGSEFIVTLPALDSPPTLTAEPTSAASSRQLRILVVDDNVGTTIIQSRLLSKLGEHIVRTAHDGPTALQQAREFLPDLIFLDIGLPGMSGYEVAKRLREQPAFSRTLLVACTGYGTQEDRERTVEAGFDVHVVKPPGIDAIREVLVHPKLQVSHRDR